MKKVFLLLLMVFMMTTTIEAFAANPWEAYDHYIPHEMLISKRHLRGIWVSTVLNLDWPSKEVLETEDHEERVRKSKDELIHILDQAVQMNMNAIFFQVSPEGDALYQSELVPWSRYLTGTFGQDPGFDPLSFVIEEAHKRNMELHAWLNPYRVSMYTNEPTTQSLDIPKSVYREHPDWIRTAMSRYVVDPGIPEARQWVIDRVMEVIRQYDVDGVHFDDYFYYERTEGELNDQQTYIRYGEGMFSKKADWRRNNTYLLIKELSEQIRAAKPWVKFGISPAGIWANKADGHPEGSNTQSSLTNFENAFADTKRWVEEELIDYIAPQIYFTFANGRASYGELAAWWAGITRRKNVHLYIGQALYKINDDYDSYFKGSNGLKEFSNQLKYNVAQPRIMGSILFRAKNTFDAGKQTMISSIKKDLWATKSLVPVMPWKGGKKPEMPTQGTLQASVEGIRVSWTDMDPDTAYYAVYRFDRNEKIMTGSNMIARNLIATVRKEPGADQEYLDKAVKSAENVIYMVTALDRLHHESAGRMIGFNSSAYFHDVGPDLNWAQEAIDGLYERKIVQGDGMGAFHPCEYTKRGDFVLMLVRALGLQSEVKGNFSDVPEHAYYYNGVGILKELGIAQGRGQCFYPEDNITREDMMVITLRALAVAGADIELASERILNRYDDADQISGHARTAVASMVNSGYIEGNQLRIAPGDYATRAEITVTLHRMLTLLQ